MAKNLIIYFSRNGENYFNGSIKNIPKGNTETVAEYIQNAVGGDLFEIETVKPYSKDYYECTEEAKSELKEQALQYQAKAVSECPPLHLRKTNF